MKHYAFLIRPDNTMSTRDMVYVWRVKKNKLILLGAERRNYRDNEQAACDIIQSGEKWRAISMRDVPDRLKAHVRDISNGVLHFKSGFSVNRAAFFYKEGMIELQRLN